MCGILTSTIVAPAVRSISIPVSKSFSISEGIPSNKYSLGTPIRSPRTSLVNALSKSGTCRFAEVESFGSCPAIAFSIIAASRTVLVNGPA